MSMLAAAILGGTVATIVMVLIYVIQCAFFPLVVGKNGVQKIRVGRLVFDYLVDNVRTEAKDRS